MNYVCFLRSMCYCVITYKANSYRSTSSVNAQFGVIDEISIDSLAVFIGYYCHVSKTEKLSNPMLNWKFNFKWSYLISTGNRENLHGFYNTNSIEENIPGPEYSRSLVLPHPDTVAVWPANDSLIWDLAGSRTGAMSNKIQKNWNKSVFFTR